MSLQKLATIMGKAEEDIASVTKSQNSSKKQQPKDKIQPEQHTAASKPG